MKATQFGAACLLAAIASFGSFAAQAADDVPVVQYQYGQKLDVSKVLAIHEDSATPFDCGVVNARMDYLDSNGQPHSLSYLKYATNCNDGG